jgi:hypothetical protein
VKKDDTSTANPKTYGNNSEMQFIEIVTAYNKSRKKQ